MFLMEKSEHVISITKFNRNDSWRLIMSGWNETAGLYRNINSFCISVSRFVLSTGRLTDTRDQSLRDVVN